MSIYEYLCLSGSSLHSLPTTCLWRRPSVPAMMKTLTPVTPVQVRCPAFLSFLFTLGVVHFFFPLLHQLATINFSFPLSTASRHYLTLAIHGPISISVPTLLSPTPPSLPYPLLFILSFYKLLSFISFSLPLLIYIQPREFTCKFQQSFNMVS